MLEVRNLVVRYGRIAALHEVNLEVRAGEAVTIIGSNGAGKSTLLRAISGLRRAGSGSILFEGRNLARETPAAIVRQGIVQVPEGRMIIHKLTVLENLLMGAYSRPDADLDAELERVLEAFPALRERRQSPAGALSGGQQQMLAIGRALMAKPRLLMLDEPSLGLAPILVDKVFDLIGDIRRQGITVLLVEQNARKALQICDRAYVLQVGRIVAAGPSKELAADASIMKAYLGG